MAEAYKRHDGAYTRHTSPGLDFSAGESKGDKKMLTENFLLKIHCSRTPLFFKRVYYPMLLGDEWLGG
jgi:hypothetical protein